MAIYLFAPLCWAFFLLFHAYLNHRQLKKDGLGWKQIKPSKWLACFPVVCNLLGIAFLCFLIMNWPEPDPPADGGPPGPGDGFAYLFGLLGLFLVFVLCNVIASLAGFFLKKESRICLFLGVGAGILLWPIVLFLMFSFYF
ncbi:MAG: hypothetical protein Q4A28_04075 [Brachymonas sp.]|nr:hypothetical protein [Brachymonas sp.]